MPFSATTADRVKETSTTTGTGNITVLGAVSQYQPITKFAVNQRFSYGFVGQTGTEWETGIGYRTDATTVVREFPQDGSAAVPVNFSAGTNDFFCSVIAAEQNALMPRGRVVAASQSLGMN